MFHILSAIYKYKVSYGNETWSLTLEKGNYHVLFMYKARQELNYLIKVKVLLF